MGEWSSRDKVGQGETRKFDDIKMLIAKDLPITGFPHLDLIDVGYYIHAVAKVATLMFKANAKCTSSDPVKVRRRGGEAAHLGDVRGRVCLGGGGEEQSYWKC